MRSGAKLALVALPAVVVAALLFTRCGQHADIPKALDPVHQTASAPLKPTTRLEMPAPAPSREASDADTARFPFDLAEAEHVQLESSKDFVLERVWLKTATEPRWVERALLDGMLLPYVESELPLVIRAAGHRDYPIQRPIDYALLPVDAYTVLDFSGLGPRLCVDAGFTLDLGDAYTSPPNPERFIHRQDGDKVHLGLSRNPAHINPRSRLRSEFALTTSCDWRLDFTWEPLPETSTVLDVASKISSPEPPHTSVTVRLSAPFDFDPGDFELSYASHDRRSAVASQVPRDFDIQRVLLPEWGEIRWFRDSKPRRLVRNGDTWTLTRLSVGQEGVLVAGHVAGECMGRWLGQITPDLDVEIRLERGVFLSGRLIHGGTGRPIRRAEMALSYTGKRFKIRDAWGSRPEAWARTVSVQADTHGRFRISSTSPPAVDYAAPSRPPLEFWATFTAPFFEPSFVHHTESTREIDLGDVVLTPKAPDISFVTSSRPRVPLDTLVILKRTEVADPKLCRVRASRLQERRLDLDVIKHSFNTGTVHQKGPDKPEFPVERGLVFAREQPLFFRRIPNSEGHECIGTRELEIDLTLPKTLDPKFSLHLSYVWDGLLVETAHFKAADTREPIYLRRTIPNEDVELFLHSREGQEEQRVAVPRNTQRVTLSP